MAKLSIEQFNLAKDIGFLVEDPLEELPSYFAEWNRLGKALPQFVPDKKFRDEVEKMPLLDHKQLTSHKEHCLAFMLLGFIGTGYMWQDGKEGVPKKIPKQLAVPWMGIAKYLDMNPILSNFSYALSNYRLKDPTRGFDDFNNIQALCLFPDTESSNNFAVITVQCEKLAGPGIQAVVDAINATEEKNRDALLDALLRLAQSFEAMTKCMAQLHEKLVPDRFYNNVRPFFFGWGGEGSALPEGLIYEGLSSTPIQCHGASAAQSSTLQSFDAALGIVHDDDKRAFMEVMRQHMPGDHRRFVQAVEQRSRIKTYVAQDEELLAQYKLCVEALRGLRDYHLKIVARFIVIPSKKEKQVDRDDKPMGSGGANVMPFLKSMRDATTRKELM